MSLRNRQQLDVVIDADFLGDAHRIGTLFHAYAHGQGVFSFEYDRDWLTRPDAFAIDPDLSLHSGESYPSNASGLFRIFLDSAPDRWGRHLLDRREVLNARREQRAVRNLTEWDYLLGVHDLCRMGALRYQANEAGPFLDNDRHLAAPPFASLRELEAASLALEQDDAMESDSFSSWLTALLAPGSSLGGARPKANFTDTDGSAWIAKFPSREDRRDMGGWEMVLHQLAGAAGVDVSPAKLLPLGARYRTFATKRFDRVDGRRRFFVSALTLLGKQDGEGGSYLELAEFLSTRGSASQRATDLRQLWTRVVFNILVSNTDDHLRNHGFILERDGWRLAPAYDMNPNLGKRTHTLLIDTHGASPDLNLAMATAEFYGLKQPQAREIAEATKQVVSTWRGVATSLKLPRVEIEQLAGAFKV